MPVWEQDRSQVPLPKEMLTELPGCVAGGVPGFRAALAPSPAALPLSGAGAANQGTAGSWLPVSLRFWPL